MRRILAQETDFFQINFGGGFCAKCTKYGEQIQAPQRVPADWGPAAGDRKTGQRLQRRQSMRDFTGGDGVWKDVHNGERDPAAEQADFGTCAQ